MDDKMTPAGVAMMQSLVNMVGCDCPKEENSDYRNEEGLLVCGVCGKRKERKLNVPYLGERIVPTLCSRTIWNDIVPKPQIHEVGTFQS